MLRPVLVWHGQARGAMTGVEHDVVFADSHNFARRRTITQFNAQRLASSGHQKRAWILGAAHHTDERQAGAVFQHTGLRGLRGHVSGGLRGHETACVCERWRLYSRRDKSRQAGVACLWLRTAKQAVDCQRKKANAADFSPTGGVAVPHRMLRKYPEVDRKKYLPPVLVPKARKWPIVGAALRLILPALNYIQ